MLPDDVLLEIFDFYKQNDDLYDDLWNWRFIVHVCRRWRQVVFASPRRLDLKILCKNGTPVRNLGIRIWPDFPIVISYINHDITTEDERNLVTVLEHPDRVCGVMLEVTGSQLGRITTAMQEPFPVLKNLFIVISSGEIPATLPAVLPTEFLGGSAPRLEKIYLRGIPFPALPTLLLSSSDLVTLDLLGIPPAGYISPETMVAGLAALPRLNVFTIEFQSAAPRPDRIHPPPVARTILPALTIFEFQGASEYLEELVSRLDAPQLDEIDTCYLNQFVDFQVVQLSRFIDRSVGPKLALFRHAIVTFGSHQVTFDTSRHADDPYSDPTSATTTILCEGIEWQVSRATQMLSQFTTRLSNVAHLKLEVYLEEDCQLEDTDDAAWLHLLQQFSAVQTLRVSQELTAHVALALEDITAEVVADALPSLDLIYLGGQPASTVEKFVAARKLSDHPVTVLDTETEFDERVKSYVDE